jgi:ATP-dependent protease ClpP protease subunit
MKVPTGLLAVTLLLAGAGTSHAEVRIARDQGGQIGRYVDRYEQLRASGQTIVIDGLCASACTIILAAIPHDKICVTPNAKLAFHAAWDFGAHGHTVANPEATRTLYSMYPSQVRRWIASQGGLTPRMIFLRGRQLEAMYRPCY